MAPPVVFGPEAPSNMRRASTYSSSSALTSISPSPSSDSPKTATTTTTTFTVSLHRMTDSSSPTVDDIIPKVEEVDDESVIDEKLDSMIAGEALVAKDTLPNGFVSRRPRGRPRKHPKTQTTPLAKPSKGRSKTGCITCRKRKKKCDEAKPTCEHCRKNNVHCEGYPPRTYWGGGKGKANKEKRLSTIDRPRELPLLIGGIESDVDWFFFQHFNLQMSRVLSLWTDKRNPFKELLLPMAMEHRGLMHSVLCLSGSHLVNREFNDGFEQRQLYHFDRAIAHLRRDENMQRRFNGDHTAIVDDPVVAQTLVLCLRAICAGEVNGEHRPHLDAARELIITQQSEKQEFQEFVIEFFVYHDVSSSVTSRRPSLLMMQNIKLPLLVANREAGIFLGVVDGLFVSWSKIRQLRDAIRERRELGLKPVVDYQILNEAQSIDSHIRSWPCNQPYDTPRYTAAMLYRQCTWLYLFRTIHQSRPNPQVQEAVDEGLAFLRELPPDSSEQSVMLMPVFILGISAYVPEQRPDIRKAFEVLHNYSNLRNIQYTQQVVERVWELMDAGDEASTWDWEEIMKNMGLDFLVT